jgi:ABC-type lipoprotein release transport system permease subunit
VIRALFAPPRRGRTLLAVLGIFAASLVVGTAATVGYGLATGFDRAAEQADLPDVIARFDREPRDTVDERVRTLPNLAARSYRHEEKGIDLRANGHATSKGIVHIVLGGRRGYLVTEGRDARGNDEVVVERGLAREWDLAPGDRMLVYRGWEVEIVGVAVEPDNVAFPLTVTPRIYASDRDWDVPVTANLAQLWLADPDRADITLAQARANSFGIGDLSFVTRTGIRVLLGQAAGIVISLLVAFSLVALVAAGTMLAASAHADVQRRLPALGVQRALGFTPWRLAAGQAREAALLAAPAAALGLGAGALAVAGPSAALLAQLNEQPPGAALLPVLALCLLAITALVTAAATWPAWRAARRPPAEILRGGDLARAGARRWFKRPEKPAAAGEPRAAARGDEARVAEDRPAGDEAWVAGDSDRAARGDDAQVAAAEDRAALRDGLLATGARFAVAARGRFAASVATIAVCAGVVTLMLALAALLERLRDDPGAIGKRYQLTVRLDPFDVDEVKAIPGVADAAERYQADVADSFRLGEPLRMIAYPGDHTRFEAPPLAEGRRLRSDGEVEVGVGLADALGLRPGATFAVQTEGGSEARFRVAGVVRALEHDGRIAYARPGRLLAAQPNVGSTISVRLERGADRAAVERELEALGAPPQPVAGATTRNAAFLGVLATVLRGVGLAVGLVCLYALVQALAMTARERRGAVALLRAVGGDAHTVATVLAGAALVVAVPAALAGLLLEWLVLGPLVARLAAGFADLPLAPSAGQVALVVGGLLALSAAATTLVARRTMRERVIEGLREE